MKTIQMLIILTGFALNLTAQSANMKTAMDGYARFGQGDVAGILNSMSDEIVWVHAGNPAIVPFAGTFAGKAETGRFFQVVGQSTTITVFQPANFREEGNKVINTIHIEGTATPTGKPFAIDITVTWTFAPDGQVTRWECTGDMSTAEAAFAR